MTPQIKQLLEAKPFRPFTLETTGGNAIYVQRAEWFFTPPDQSSFAVFTETGYWIFDFKDLTANILVHSPHR